MFIANIDSLFFSIDIKNYVENNAQLINYLEKKKEIAKKNRNTDVFVILEGKKFKIMPNGVRFHSFILHNDTMELKVASFRSTAKNNYPVSIRIKSLKLWQNGYIRAYEDIINFLKTVFVGDFISEKLSRADICCHTDEVFIDDIDITSWRGKYKKQEVHLTNRKVNGMTFGSFKDKNIMCRIYDKSLEIKTSGKTWFNDIWRNNNLNIEKVWNIEFQLGRKFFKERKIETVIDFILKTKTMWKYLTTEWINFIINDDINISRCTVRKNWTSLIKAYDNYVGEQMIKFDKQRNRRAEKLIPLLVGVFSSYGACKQRIAPEEIIEEFKQDMQEYLKEKKANIPPEQFILNKLEYLFS